MRVLKKLTCNSALEQLMHIRKFSA